jgi:hypothetical protein
MMGFITGNLPPIDPAEFPRQPFLERILAVTTHWVEYGFGAPAFNFGDGHLHDERLIRAVQRRCNFAPGEFLVAWIESQPIHKKTQRYKVIDAALGVIETGTYLVADAVAEQPWLPNGPIPCAVEWSRETTLPRTPAEQAEPQEPSMPAPLPTAEASS